MGTLGSKFFIARIVDF